MDRKILIVEDDRDITDLIEIHLNDYGFKIKKAYTGDDGVKRALSESFDLIILDLMLPGLDGVEVCRQIREHDKVVPILMLTARSEEMDKILGLEIGANDYITKPFQIRELIARIKANLRSVDAIKEQVSATDEPERIDIHDLNINLKKRQVLLSGKTVDLTAKEYDLLSYFASHPGRAFSREQLLNTVWGYQFSGYEHTVNSHINRLRSKIEENPAQPKYIKTVWGVGYRFSEEEES
jgi:DNA-binding response OmpR family regulator